MKRYKLTLEIEADTLTDIGIQLRRIDDALDSVQTTDLNKYTPYKREHISELGKSSLLIKTTK